MSCKTRSRYVMGENFGVSLERVGTRIMTIETRSPCLVHVAKQATQTFLSFHEIVEWLPSLPVLEPVFASGGTALRFLVSCAGLVRLIQIRSQHPIPHPGRSRCSLETTSETVQMSTPLDMIPTGLQLLRRCRIDGKFKIPAGRLGLKRRLYVA